MYRGKCGINLPYSARRALFYPKCRTIPLTVLNLKECRTDTIPSESGFLKLAFLPDHRDVIHDFDWKKESFSENNWSERRVDGKSSSAFPNVTPFITVIFTIFFHSSLNVREWPSHLPRQYYSVELTGHFPERKKQRPACFYGFSHTGDLSGILHRPY